MDNTAPGESWNVERGLIEVREAGCTHRLPELAQRMRSSLAPVDTGWLGDRLSLLWLSMGHSKDGDIATAWLNETSRLLADLPEDILAEAVDEAVKASDRGFLPSVGAIRKIADPLLAKRRRAAFRLEAMVNWKAPETDAGASEDEGWTVERVRDLPVFAARIVMKSGAISREMFDEAFPPVEGNEGEA